MPTRAEVDADIVSKITDKTAAGSLSNIDDGANRELMLDYIDQQVPYTLIVGLLSYDGITFTFLPIVNLTGATISWSKFSGNVILTSSIAIFTNDKTIVNDQSVNSGGGYIVTGRQSNTTNISLSFTNTAGTTSTVPNFDKMPIEIKIYN